MPMAPGITPHGTSPRLHRISNCVNFDLYCQEKAAVVGTPSYYALGQAALVDRPALTALLAFQRELEDTVEHCSEVAVGQAKLAWWHAEIAKLAVEDASRDPSPGMTQRPTHPVTLALAAHWPRVGAQVPALQAMVEGYEMDLEQARYLDFPGLSAYLDKTRAQAASLIAEVTGAAGVDGAARQAAARLGHALGLAQVVRDVGRHARQGRIYIPVNEMQRFGVTAADVINRRYSDAFSALMQFQIERARTGLRDACADLRGLRRRLRATLEVEAALALALLDEIEAEHYQVLHQQLALTPLRMAWLAWRAGR